MNNLKNYIFYVSPRNFSRYVYLQLNLSKEILLMRTMSKMGNRETVVERLFVVEENKKLGKGKHATTKSKLQCAAKVSPLAIEEVFNHWKTVMNKRPTVVLDEHRRQNIGAAIHDYGIQACKQAIEGCSMSDFHMGRNKQNKRYDNIELILRDSIHIEKFIDVYEQHNKGPKW